MDAIQLSRAIKAHITLIIAAALLAGLAAAGVRVATPPTYRSEATLMFSEVDATAALLGQFTPQSNKPERFVQSQIDVLSLPSLAGSAVESAGLDVTPSQLLDKVSIIAKPVESNLVTIQVKDTDPARAAAEANALANAYIGWSRRMSSVQLDQAAAAVQEELDRAEWNLNRSSNRLNSAKLQATAQSFEKLADQRHLLRMRKQLDDARAHLVFPAVESKATVISPSPVTYGLMGMLLGLVVGLALAIFLELRSGSNPAASADVLA